MSKYLDEDMIRKILFIRVIVKICPNVDVSNTHSVFMSNAQQIILNKTSAEAMRNTQNARLIESGNFMKKTWK